MEIEGITPCILIISTGYSRMFSFMPQLFYPWYAPDRKLDAPQNWSGRSGEEKNLLPL
jgi:hypothetical protein